MQMIERLSQRVKKLSLSEIGILKVCVAAFALLVGAYNARKVKKYSLPLFVTFVLSAAYMAIRLYFEDEGDEDDDFDFDFDFDFDDEDDEDDDEDWIDPILNMEICAEAEEPSAVPAEAQPEAQPEAQSETQSEDETDAPAEPIDGEAPADADVQDSENEPE